MDWKGVYRMKCKIGTVEIDTRFNEYKVNVNLEFSTKEEFYELIHIIEAVTVGTRNIDISVSQIQIKANQEIGNG